MTKRKAPPRKAKKTTRRSKKKTGAARLRPEKKEPGAKTATATAYNTPKRRKRSDGEAGTLPPLDLCYEPDKHGSLDPRKLPRPKGRLPEWLREQWLRCVAELLLSGIDSPQYIAQLTGWHRKTIERWIEEIHALWRETQGEQLIRFRWSRMVERSEYIAQQCIRRASAAKTADAQERLYKTALMADAQQTRLLGLGTQTTLRIIAAGGGQGDQTGADPQAGGGQVIDANARIRARLEGMDGPLAHDFSKRLAAAPDIARAVEIAEEINQGST